MNLMKWSKIVLLGTGKQRLTIVDIVVNAIKKYRLMACFDEKTEPYELEGLHNIWHFSLENNDHLMNYGVYANGLLVETTSIRMMHELSGMELV